VWECKRLFCYSAKSVTEKNNRRVDCAEADKKTVQAQRYEGRGFLAAGDLPCIAACNELLGESLTTLSITLTA